MISTRRTLHIIDTIFMDDNEVLVHFSDGTGAIYEAEELEKLRPAPKYMVPAETLPNPKAYAEVA
jgi:hypothetical protein